MWVGADRGSQGERESPLELGQVRFETRGHVYTYHSISLSSYSLYKEVRSASLPNNSRNAIVVCKLLFLSLNFLSLDFLALAVFGAQLAIVWPRIRVAEGSRTLGSESSSTRSGPAAILLAATLLSPPLLPPSGLFIFLV